MTDFKPGEKAILRMTNVEVAVDAAPVTAYGITFEDGTKALVSEAELKPIPPADPRVDVVARAIARFYDNESIVDESPEAAHAVLSALDAMPQGQNGAGAIPGVIEGLFPSAPRRVRDRDGDVWERNAQGLWDCRAPGISGEEDGLDGRYEWVDRNYGPLTDV